MLRNIIKNVYIHHYIKSFVKHLLCIIMFIIGFILPSVNAQTTDLVLTNKNISTTESFSATNSITAGPNFTITNSGNVTLITPFMAIKSNFFVINGGELQVISDSIEVNLKTENLALPDEFKLYQNYPNPFNPSTTIKYSIPKQSNLTLKVFDILGSEVTTLINKEQSQGDYEIEFDVGELTSGIYFYRLKAGDFVEIKKMILLK